MNQLSLKFLSNDSSAELFESEFSCPLVGRTLRCARGRYAFTDSLEGTFQWTSAVQSMSAAVIKSKLAVVAGTRPQAWPQAAGLCSDATSWALSLDFALSKKPRWLLDMFGVDKSGTSIIKRLFIRMNPEKKRPGPLWVSVNPAFLEPGNISIFLDGVEVTEAPELTALLKLIGLDEQISLDRKGAPQVVLVPNRQIGSHVVIADSDLVVIKSVSVAWRLEERLQDSGITTRRVTWSWSEELLQAMSNGFVDIAIYNTNSALRFIEENPPPKFTLVCEWGHSMGGKNFYVIARKDSSWSCAGIHSFLERIKRGATIIVPERSDMIANVLSILNTSEKGLAALGVKILSVPVSQGLEALDVNPEALLIHGQNVRFKGRFRGLYKEILNYDSLPSHTQQALLKNSSNSVLVSNSCLEKYSKQTLFAAIEEARREFFASWTDSQLYPELVKELVENERKYGIVNEDEMTYVVKQILYETYRFGAPGA